MARFEYQNFVYIGAASERVTLAMECAADQTGAAFWEFHDRFLVDGSRAASRDQLVDFAGGIGLDTGVFAQCFDSNEHEDAINARTQAARALGVSYGPRVFVNGERSGITLVAIKRDVEAATP